MKHKKIGIVGLGLMGGGIGKNLLRKKYAVLVFDVVETKAESLRALGAKVAPSIKDLTVNSDIIITSLPSPDAVREVCLGNGGIIENAREGQVLIETSTMAEILSHDNFTINREYKSM